MESEFVALAAVGKEAEWLRNLILEILLWSKPITPIFILCDIAATLAKDYNQIYNGKSRHLIVKHSMIRELIMNGVISIEFVRSQQNLANHLTKGLARDMVLKSTKRMGLKPKWTEAHVFTYHPKCHTPTKVETRGVTEELIVITQGVNIENTKCIETKCYDVLQQQVGNFCQDKSSHITWSEMITNQNV
ncbi:hypothetical protein Tco_0850442 [Tanacetum coccineum]